jgi:general secretion pathway protein D
MLLLLVLFVASGDCQKVPPQKKIKVTLKQETDVGELVAWASALSCKKILLPKTLQDRKVTLFAPDTMTAEQGWPLFLAALNSVGLTVLPSGDALVVSETLRAKEAAPVLDALPHDDRYVTQMLKFEHATPTEVATVLDKLRSKDAQLIPHDASGTLIVMDTAANVRRMAQVARSLDVAGPSETFWIIPLRAGNATQVADRIGQVFPPAAKDKPGLKIVGDDASRSLLLVAPEATYQKVVALVRKLEETRENNNDDEDGWVHLVPLEHANADELAATLGAMGGVSVGSTPASQSKPVATAGATGAPPIARPPTPSGASSASATASPSALFGGEVRVIAEHASNSLIVLASAQDYLQLKNLIRKLDVTRRQVLIEATILEVSLDRLRDLNLSLHGGDVSGSGNVVFGGSNAGATIGAATSDGQQALLGDMAQGLAVGVIGSPFEVLPGVSVPSFGVFLHALATSTDVHILSTPHLMTMDNEPATIVVGQNLPFQGAAPPPAAASGTTTLVQGFIPVERKDVALSLSITPQINQGGSVRLKVVQEVSDVLAANFNNLGPATSKRHLETTVEVDNEQPIVLGGLITERVEDTESKVPILGDIPILGWFFKSQKKHTTKANLLIFLVPYVIHDRSDLRRIYERKDRESREFAERQTAFRDARDLHADIDYRHKRGLLVAIDRAAREADEDAALRARLGQKRASAGPISPPSPAVGAASSTGAATGIDPQTLH